MGEHAAARLDRGQLVGVADQHRLGPGCRCGGEQLAQIVGADHAGLIDDHQVEMAEFEGTVLQAVQGFGDGVAGVAGAFAHRDIDGLAGRRQHQDLPGRRRAAAASARIEGQRPCRRRLACSTPSSSTGWRS